ncbi:hypothetical protein R6Q57_019722 [Mikania cordata]
MACSIAILHPICGIGTCMIRIGPIKALDRAYCSQTTTIYAVGALNPLKLHIELYKSGFEPNLLGSSFHTLQVESGGGDLQDHLILQFPEGSTAAGWCAKFHTMKIGQQKAVDWDILTEIGERAHPSYKEVAMEFLSTFTYLPGGVPDIAFSMLRQRHDMSLVEFAVLSGLYWEPETVTPLYTSGITEIDDATLCSWWPHIAEDPFIGTMARVSCIRVPLIRNMNRLIAT